jgi:hypothetical protein
LSDYGRFLRMLLNHGERDARAQGRDVALTSQNHIGTVGVPALKTPLSERSADFTLITDGRGKWGLGFLITADEMPGKRSSGSLSWGGINNTYLDRPYARRCGRDPDAVPASADPKALAVYDAFERGAYRLVSAGER